MAKTEFLMVLLRDRICGSGGFLAAGLVHIPGLGPRITIILHLVLLIRYEIAAPTLLISRGRLRNIFFRMSHRSRELLLQNWMPGVTIWRIL